MENYHSHFLITLLVYLPTQLVVCFAWSFVPWSQRKSQGSAEHGVLVLRWHGQGRIRGKLAAFVLPCHLDRSCHVSRWQPTDAISNIISGDLRSLSGETKTCIFFAASYGVNIDSTSTFCCAQVFRWQEGFNFLVYRFHNCDNFIPQLKFVLVHREHESEFSDVGNAGSFPPEGRKLAGKWPESCYRFTWWQWPLAEGRKIAAVSGQGFRCSLLEFKRSAAKMTRGESVSPHSPLTLFRVAGPPESVSDHKAAPKHSPFAERIKDGGNARFGNNNAIEVRKRSFWKSHGVHAPYSVLHVRTLTSAEV